jgi:L-seryl-tRNA(Ser) seleniumtransferase
MVAVEIYTKKDHKAEWAEWESRAQQIIKAVSAVNGVKAEVQIPEISNHVPHVHITWDPSVINLKPREVAKLLRSGDPSIEPTPSPDDRVVIGVWMMQPGDAAIVARRLRQILSSAKA